MADRSQDWCFTSYEDCPPVFKGDVMDFLSYGKETCPKTKRLHWQGFVQFSKDRSLGVVKKYLGSLTIHVEIRRGTSVEADKYCGKDGAYTAHGKFTERPARKTAEEFRNAIKGGMLARQLWEEYPSFMTTQYGVYKELSKLYRPKRKYGEHEQPVAELVW